MPAISRSTLYFTRVLNRSEFCDHRTIVPFHVFKQLDMKQFARYCPHMLTPAQRRRSTERTSKCVIVIGFRKCNANVENSEKNSVFVFLLSIDTCFLSNKRNNGVSHLHSNSTLL